MKTILNNYILWIAATTLVGNTLSHKYGGSEESKEQFSKASLEFTLDLLKNVVDKNNSSNVIFSPVSISLLLSILQQGAKKNTASQLEKVLHLSTEESRAVYKSLSLLKEEKNVTLEWGNRCYIKSGLEIDNAFQKTVKEIYNVDVEEMEFGVPSPKDSSEKINNWVKEITQNQITDLVDPSTLTPETILVLINAIFFKGTWLNPFKKTKTAEDQFEMTLENSVQILFMSQRGKFYADKDSFIGAKWVHLPFQNNRFAMIFILPTKRHQLNQLIEKLSGEDLDQIFSHRGVSRVKLRIPKFKLSKKVSLVETLQRIGLTDIFTGASDLSGISSTFENLQVSEIIHQANVEIDEKGGTGSAATVVQLLRMRTPNLSFFADQPFLFFIVDIETKIPLFAGKVVNPKS